MIETKIKLEPIKDQRKITILDYIRSKLDQLLEKQQIDHKTKLPQDIKDYKVWC